MNKIIFFGPIILMMLTSCATTYKNENQHFLGIKAAMARDQYSLAMKEILIFKEKYPNSEYICELLPIQIAWKKDRGHNANQVEDEFKAKCKK